MAQEISQDTERCASIKKIYFKNRTYKPQEKEDSKSHYHPLNIPLEIAPVVCYSTRRTPFTKLVPFGMPKLGRYKPILDTAFFLYRSVEDAQLGKDCGGTGFLVSVPTPWPDRVHVYGVTNWHVAVDAGASVIRLNTKDGNAETFDLGPEAWQFIPNFHDIAVVPLEIKQHHNVKHLQYQFMRPKEYVLEQEVGPGDDVFMIGRFIDYDGVQTNHPSMRFGHISMADAPIRQPNGYAGGSFIVDMHSRSGFSGSPVFMYRTLGSHFLEGEKGSILTGAGHMMYLLGIHWGQFPESWELKNKPLDELSAEASMVVDGAYVNGLSGMTCVCPSHAIIDVLDMLKLKEHRRYVEKMIEKVFGPAPITAHTEVDTAASPELEPPTTDDNSQPPTQ